MFDSNEEQLRESDLAFAFSIFMLNTLILAIVVGGFWLARILISNANQLNDLVSAVAPVR